MIEFECAPRIWADSLELIVAARCEQNETKQTTNKTCDRMAFELKRCLSFIWSLHLYCVVLLAHIFKSMESSGINSIILIS